ncbi:urate oxidase [Roseomonas sp. NAR14]|uniref:Uricase n=1 Tax=Roseomonas acroporae TaxID=2937791 RepID=A0A9X1YA22_9PROT|nr:urate oxidase [Roseomonas acroporae]MCK8786684.1 urate oxidase [Roseomonas acroporae]
MSLVSKTYGKGKVRVMRVHRDGERHEVRDLSVQAMVTGDFGRAFTDADNSTSLCTDTVKNIVNIVARENMTLQNEPFCKAVAEKLLGAYPQVESATVTAHETKWVRLAFGGTPHPHSFVLDSNGRPYAKVVATRDAVSTLSGVSGFSFLKSTQSGWSNFHKDGFTTLAETDDRIAATAMEASWHWNAEPADYEAANAKILSTMIEVFATTYSYSVQDSLYRMGTAALEAVPEIEDVSMACPNKHYIPLNLKAFGLENNNQVFVATDEPHGQIECTVGRG